MLADSLDMNLSKRPWLVLLGLVVLILPVAGRYLRRGGPPRCALDGIPIDPVYRVRVVEDGGAAHDFCCPHCAELWLKQQGRPPRSITVTDESTHEPLDAAAASYARSMVVTQQANGNRIHVFGRRADAEKHAETFSGIVLGKSMRPFADYTGPK
jgi:hypothetical protein